MEPMVPDHTDRLNTSERWDLPFPKEDWEKTPHTVRLYINALEQKIAEQQKTIEALYSGPQKRDSMLR